MKLSITQVNVSSGKRETKILEAASETRIPIELRDSVQISRDGELPVRITKLADGVVVQWKDGSYVVLVPTEGDEADAVRQASINEGGDAAPLDDFMTWQAAYDDGDLDFAPLGPYSIPSIEMGLEESDLFLEPVLQEEAVIFASPSPLESTAPLLAPPPDLPPSAFDDSNFLVDVDSAQTVIGGNVLQNLLHGMHNGEGPFSDVADIDPEGLALFVIQAGPVGGQGVATGSSSATVTGQYGALTMQSDGSYVYDLDESNPAPEALDDGESLIDSFSYVVSEPAGQTAAATLTITIFGTNDTPVANADTNWAQEDTVDASGNVLQTLAHNGAPSGTFGDVADTDIDVETLTVSSVNGVAGNVGVAVAGLYGTLTLNNDGTYGYVLNNAHAAVQALDVGETITDVFSYTATDGTASSASATLTVTIFGTNDTPVANADTNWAQEDIADASGNVLQTLAHNGAPSGVFGDVADSDVDTETLAVSSVNGVAGNVGVAVAGLYGTLTLQSDGSYSYTLNNAHATVQGLDDGETITDVFSYTATDGTAASASATLTITIFGTNDVPVAAADTNWAQEDVVNATGNVLQTLAHNGAPSGVFGDVADSDVDTETLTVSSVNGVSGNVGVAVAGLYGTLTLQSNGSYGYTLNNAHAAVQALDDGETIIDVFSYTATDGTAASASATLTVTIFGTNDTPVAAADTNWAQEDTADASGNVLQTLAHNGAPSGVFGDVADTDIDVETLTVSTVNGNAGNVGIAVAGLYGTLTLQSNGSYSYTLNNAHAAVQGLDDGETITDAFSYTATDGTAASASATLTITIFGTNDTPVANADTNWAQEDTVDASGNVLQTLAHNGAPSGVFGDVADSDVDTETLTVSSVNGVAGNVGAAVAGLYGTLTLQSNGSYSYTLNDGHAAVQGLDDGETITDVFSYTATDGTASSASATLTITIFGTNDVPLAAADTNWAQEDFADATGNVLQTLAHNGAPSGVFGDVADSDVDTETLTVSSVNGVAGNVGVAVAGLYGTLTLQSDGSYSYTLNNAHATVQGLDDGETITDVFSYTASDGTASSASATLTITIFGTNDVPLAAADTNWAQEDFADATGNVLQTLAHNGAPSGVFGDVADSDVDTETLTVSSVNGVAGNVGAAVAGLYGTLTLQSNGSYSYTLNNAHAAVQALDDGETITDVFSYTATDGTAASASATLTITIFGTNDVPVAAADTNWAQEDVVNATGNVLQTLAHNGAPSGVFGDVADSDVDAETLAVSSVNGVAGNVGAAVAGLYGTLTLQSNGSYSYILNNGHAAVQGLDDGETITDVFSYTASDGTAASASATLTITIFGTNDVPVAAADTNWAQEDTVDASGNVLQTLAHNGAPSGVFGDVVDSDVDTETLTVSSVNGVTGNVGVAVAGLYGTLTLNNDGTYGYVLNNAHATVQGLDDGETITDVFSYTASDGTAASASATLTITIFGTNDVPVAAADTNWAQEDTVDASGNVLQTLAHNGAPSGVFGDVVDSDVDTETLTVSSVNGVTGNVGVAVAGLYGTLTLNNDGTYGYVLNNAHATVQGLDDGETITDVFSYTASDGTAASASATLTITIFGTNDTPVANADTNWAQEDIADASGNVLQTLAHNGAPSGVFGDVADSDVDTETLTVSSVNGVAGNVGVAVAGLYGTLTLNNDGTYGYVLNNAHATVQGLDDGETITDVFSYTASDGTAASASATLTITIFGTNDTPVANADTNWAQEDIADASGNVLQTLAHNGAPSGVFGDVADSDVDTETLTVSSVNGVAGNVGVAVAGLYGTLTLNNDGTYGYVLNNAHAAVQALDDGETITDVFSYTATDGTASSASATLTVTIFGTNDVPLAAADTNWVQEDVVNATGNVLQTLAHNGAPSGAFGDVVDSDVDTETLTVSSVNGVTGNVGVAVAGLYGTLTLQSDGSYSYTLNNGHAAVQGLDDGETITDVFSYTATDGTASSASATLTIRVFGTNDIPVAAADTNWAQEDVINATGNVLQTLAHNGAPTGVFGDVADSDVDTETLAVSSVNGVAGNVGVAVAGLYGTLTLQSNGSYSYTLSNGHAAVQGLDDGETITDVFSYTATDGTASSASATLTITIFGTNDVPVAAADTNWAQEDTVDASGNVLQTLAHNGAPSGAFGDVADSDVDTETLTVSSVNGVAGNVGVAVAGLYGTLTLQSDGSYSYTLNNAHATVQGLDDGEIIADVFSYTATDGTASSASATLTITIFGTNDTPVAAADTNWAQEDTVDASGNVLQTLAHNGAPSGVFGDVADSDVDTETLTVSSVNGVAGNVGVAVAGLYGTLTLQSNGSYSYTLNNGHATVQGLDDGETITDVFSYTATDGTASSASATLTITIFGTNDVPLAAADTNWVQEDVVNATGNVLQTLAHNGAPSGVFGDVADSDVDTETLTVSSVNGVAGNVGVAVAGLYGTLTLQSNGSYSYTLNNAHAAVQALDDGETITDVFSYTATDGTAASASATLTITIFGTNDVPVAAADTNWVQEDVVNATGNVLQTLAHNGAPSGVFGDVADTDIDVETLTVSTVNGNAGNVGVAVAGLYGTLTLQSDGSYSYTLNNGHATVQGLDDGETITDVFSYTATDGTAASASATLTITIFGTNDVPVAAADTNWAQEDVVNATGNVLQTLAHNGAPSGVFGDVADSDVDTETLTVSSVNGVAGNVGAAVAGLYGTLTLQSNGSYSYTLNNGHAAVQGLDDGETITDVFSYTATDGTASSASATLTITIFGTNDVPVAAADTNWAQEDFADATGNVLQTLAHNGAPSGVFGDVADSDVDTETLTVSSVNGVAGNVGVAVAGLYGTLTLQSNGSYSYTLNNGHATVQGLDDGETITDVFSYTATDGTAASASATLTITIFGTNDVPLAAADTNWAQEDVINATGNVLQTLAHNGAPTGVFGDVADSDVDTETLTVSSVNGVAGNVGVAVAGLYGTLTLNNDGTYGYVLNNAHAAVQALDDGETITDVFSYTATDGTAASASATLTITIFGTNDVPVAAADTNWAQEDVVNATGNVLQTLAHNGAPSGVFGDVADSDVDAETLAVSSVNGVAGNVGVAVAGLYGTLTLQSNGSYSYTLNNAHAAVQGLDDGETIADVFSYTATDGTAASASATLTITIFGTNDVPVASADTNWAQEDTADATGNVLQTLAHNGAPSGVFGDVADSDVDVETLSVSTVNGNAGNVGIAVAGLYGTLTLNNDGTYNYVLNNAHAAVQALGVGETVTDAFSYTATDGTASAGATLTITIFGANDAPVVGAGTALVSEEGLAGANPDTVGNPTDGTNSATASGTISVVDPDGQPLTVTLVAPPLGVFTSGAQNVIWAGGGTNHLVGSVGSTNILDVTIDNSGAYTVTLQGPIDHAADDFENLFVFSFGVDVSDGTTTVSTSLTVTFEDDSPTGGSNATVIVDDDDVVGAGGNPGGVGDSAPANVTGTVAHSFGADGGSIAWLSTGAPAGFSYQVSGNNLLVKQGATTVLTINLNPNTGFYSVVQNAVILHALGASENNEAFTLNYRISDADGDTVDGSLDITVNDDTPTIVTPDGETLNNAAGASSTSSLPLPRLDSDGDIDNNMGADKPGTIAFANVTNGQQATGVIDGNTVNLTSGVDGSLIKLYLVDHDSNSATPDRLEGWADGAPGDVGASQIFTVTLNHDPTNATPDTYQVNVLSLIGATSDVEILNFAPLGSNSQAFKVLQDPLGLGTDQDLLFSGYTRSGAGVTDIATGGSSVSASTVGIGVANNSMNDTDNLRIDFVSTATVTTGNNNNYDYTAHYNINNFLFKIVQDNTSGSPTNHIDIWVRIYNADNDNPAGSTATHAVALNTGDTQLATITTIEWFDASSSTTTNLNLGALTTDGSGGYLIPGLDLNDTITVVASGTGYNRIEIENPISGAHGVTSSSLNGEAFDIGAFAFTADVVNIPQVDLSFEVGLTDADGDTIVSTTPINITLNAPAPPVALDLNGDGVQYMTHDDPSNHVRFDFNGDGVSEKLSWVSQEDGILVYDRNGDHSVNDPSEFVFTRGHEDATTDLGALRMYYDGNFDGLLDSRDEMFANFGVWQDANGNGLSDSGEFQSLADLGIASISLYSDGNSYATAGGEVQVYGQTLVTHVDGTTSIAEDASFTIFSQEEMAPEGMLAGEQDTVEALLPVAGSGNLSPQEDGPEAGAGTQAESNLIADSASGGEMGAELSAVSVPDIIAPIEDAPAAVA